MALRIQIETDSLFFVWRPTLMYSSLHPIIVHKIIRRKRNETLHIYGVHMCARARSRAKHLSILCIAMHTCLLLSSDFRYWIHVFTAITCLFTFSVGLYSCCGFFMIFHISYVLAVFSVLVRVFCCFECRHRNTAIYVAQNENTHIRNHCLIWACDSIWFFFCPTPTPTPWEPINA